MVGDLLFGLMDCGQGYGFRVYVSRWEQEGGSGGLGFFRDRLGFGMNGLQFGLEVEGFTILRHCVSLSPKPHTNPKNPNP